MNNIPRKLLSKKSGVAAETLEKMSGQTTQLCGINTQYESIG